MDIVQSAGLTSLFLILSFIIYSKASERGNEHYLRWMTKIFILISGILLFVNVNLFNSTRLQIQTSTIISKYMVPATMDLIGTVHDPANSVHMEENRIYINRGTDKEKVFLIMQAPFFGIIDQSKSNELSKELGAIH